MAADAALLDVCVAAGAAVLESADQVIAGLFACARVFGWGLPLLLPARCEVRGVVTLALGVVSLVACPVALVCVCVCVCVCVVVAAQVGSRVALVGGAVALVCVCACMLVGSRCACLWKC